MESLSVQTPAQQPTSSQWPKWRRPALIAAGVIVVAGAAIWINQTYGSSDEVSYQTSRYSLNNEIKKLDASDKGGAITFISPAQFTSTYKDDEQVIWYQSTAVRGTSVSTGYLAALHTKGSPAPTPSYLKEMNKALLDPKDSRHATYAAALRKFVQDHTGSEYQLNFATPLKFTNPNINSNAWQLDFSYDLNSKSATHLPDKKQGKVILLAGKQTWYYFMLTAIEPNWQTNQDIWQQILSSVKIDQ